MPSYAGEPVYSRDMGIRDVGNVIARACARRGWQFKKTGRGRGVATYTKGRLWAALDIQWTDSDYGMSYRDSRGFHYTRHRNSIHPRFVHWFKRLRYTIDVEMRRAGERSR